MAKRFETFIVRMEVPEGATISDVKAYIRDAVGSWCGGLHPEDPLFGCHNVTVKTVKS